ncbi:MAG: hypothetical protein IK085_11325, partial [Clostridia bacterium]|nr:hypothetical protein [Clostridia bacterium]
MKKRIISLLTVFTLVLLSATPVFAVRLDGVNGGEYSTKEYQTLFSGKSESGNNATLAQAFIKTENTMCYILFSVVCDDVD